MNQKPNNGIGTEAGTQPGLGDTDLGISAVASGSDADLCVSVSGGCSICLSWSPSILACSCSSGSGKSSRFDLVFMCVLLSVLET